MQSADATFRSHDDPISRRRLLQATAAVAGLLAAQPIASRAAMAPTGEALVGAVPAPRRGHQTATPAGASGEIQPSHRHPPATLDDLHRRLDRTRWQHAARRRLGAGRAAGYLQELAAYWRNEYDWRAWGPAQSFPSSPLRSMAPMSISCTWNPRSWMPCRWSSPTAGPAPSSSSWRSSACWPTPPHGGDPRMPST